MSGLGCRTRLAFGTRWRNFAKASLGSFKVNPRLRLGLTLNSPRLASYELIVQHEVIQPPQAAAVFPLAVFFISLHLREPAHAMRLTPAGV